MINVGSEGHIISYLNTSGSTIASGTVFKIGEFVGANVMDIANNETGAVVIAGTLPNAPKTTGEAWTQLQTLYWNDTTKKLTTTAGSNIIAGWAWESAASAATTGTVKLKG
jgi:predicted RecA/RadA family phage recombinase